MKNNNMTGASFGLSLDPAPAAGGGGSAVAAPPAAAPAPAPAAAAPSAPATPATPTGPAPAKTGFFKDLKRAAVAPPEAPPAAGAPPAAEGNKIQVFEDDGKTLVREFTTQAEADAFVKAGVRAPAATPAPPADILAKPFLGRADIATQAAAEELFRKSQTEGVRLAGELKARDAKILEADARMASLTKELELARKTPAVPDLSDEQLDALFKENPRQAHEYVKTKDARDYANREAVASAAAEVKERAETTRRITAETVKTWESMAKDTKSYPQFAELESRIDAIYTASLRDGKSPFDSNPDAPKMLYRMAMGDIRLELLGRGVEVAADAAETARLKSESDAAALRAAGGGAGAAEAGKPDARTPQQKSDDEWRESRRKARAADHSRIFRERKPT